MNIRQCRGNPCLWKDTGSFPYIVPASQAIFLAVGMLVPATDPARPWRSQGESLCVTKMPTD